MTKATSHYDKFFIPSWQRKLDLDRVRSLKRRIEKRDLSHTFPITVRKVAGGRYMITDGQHRFTALKELGRPIKFVESKDHFHVVDLIEASKDTRSWSVRDVLDSWSARGKDGYRFIKSALSRFELPDSAIRVLTSKFSTDEYNRGAVSFNDAERENVTSFLEFAKAFNDTAQNPDSKKRAVFAALWEVYNISNFNESRMLLRLQTYPNKFHYYSSKSECVEMLKGLYNYRTLSTERI